MPDLFLCRDFAILDIASMGCLFTLYQVDDPELYYLKIGRLY
jgi:hypothetical protein